MIVYVDEDSSHLCILWIEWLTDSQFKITLFLGDSGEGAMCPSVFEFSLVLEDCKFPCVASSPFTVVFRKAPFFFFFLPVTPQKCCLSKIASCLVYTSKSLPCRPLWSTRTLFIYFSRILTLPAVCVRVIRVQS